MKLKKHYARFKIITVHYVWRVFSNVFSSPHDFITKFKNTSSLMINEHYFNRYALQSSLSLADI